MGGVESLPEARKYGIGILGLSLPEIPAFDKEAEYKVADTTKDIEIYTWKEVTRNEELWPTVERLITSEFFPTGKTKVAAQAQALFRSGIVVYAQPKVGANGELQAEKLTLETLHVGGSAADMIIVIAKEGVKLDLTLETKLEKSDAVFARTMIVLTEGDATVGVVSSIHAAEGAAMLLTERAIIADHASYSGKEILAGNFRLAQEKDALLVGEEARADMAQAIIPSGSAYFDITVSAEHRAAHTEARVAARGASFHASRVVYRGLIDAKEGVTNITGAQDARFLVLSPEAKVDAIPALDIAAKEVSVSHKLSVTHIRPGDAFYAKLRGLNDEESRALLLESHFAEVFPGEENNEILNKIGERIALPEPDFK